MIFGRKSMRYENDPTHFSQAIAFMSKTYPALVVGMGKRGVHHATVVDGSRIFLTFGVSRFPVNAT